MTVVTIGTPTTGPRSSHPKAVIRSDVGVDVVLPYAPTGATLGGLSHDWEVVARPGRDPLTLHVGAQAPTMSVTFPVLNPADHQADVETLLAGIRRVTEQRARITFDHLSPAERGPWRCTDLAIDVIARQYGTNRATSAVVSMSLVRASDPKKFRGPVSGGKNSGKGSKGTSYTAKAGDTLRSIADKFYGNPGMWKVIAKANGIKKPAAPLKGKTLTIPPKKAGK